MKMWNSKEWTSALILFIFVSVLIYGFTTRFNKARLLKEKAAKEAEARQIRVWKIRNNTWLARKPMKAVRVRHDPPSTTDFFPFIKGNLTKLTWAHAVNNASYLNESLASDNVMMIEADIVFGTLIDDPSGILLPIMGHPPTVTSDLSLQQFLDTVDTSNLQSQATLKGVKLDFKSTEVLEMSLYTVNASYQKISYPMWLNADILPGPIDSQVDPVDAGRFLSASKTFPKAMLSIGWTTQYGGDLTYGSYSDNHIQDMITALRENDVKQSVTFPVRAGLAANSLTQLTHLLSETTGLNSTLTIWSSEGDNVDIDKLRTLIFACGLEKVYLDVPEEVSSKLNL